MVHSSFNYVETIKERKEKQGETETLKEKAEDMAENVYWAYYVHLPFYVMTEGDSFWLHVFFLLIFSMGLFGVLKWFLL
ncbi:hypothetical protein Kpol_251p5 [Vanderwaltozyma polyspora DSM 70294]|uniref:Uncharacterized protein n=1 Tax=Vanderwaltozyma polyspora (strain ATCC 22028 / DSM 70294 / BCRC 21397 / CBS 2163 / NBRC 10782 / NRRL Y-8283 / UCD 57-17) TaxID=436907 RepID=A7TTD4_VANPO|nr:uncharacterized protein Kpol_251p5 [Vanderwaltozyma polyspora DSM 70294]EDO14475.1 hypothetical protein Kpol_251p5 [Vanderwaltozyma polyspora DSM 70294]